jgi:hypothetical protein
MRSRFGWPRAVSHRRPAARKGVAHVEIESPEPRSDHQDPGAHPLGTGVVAPPAARLRAPRSARPPTARTLAGGVVGAIAGGLAGKEIAENANPTEWRRAERAQLGTGVGASAGAVTGAAIGAVSGPVGMATGAAIARPPVAPRAKGSAEGRQPAPR